MGIYYISDCHLGHRGIISSCARPFSSVQEMDAHLLRGLTALSPEDDLYCVGDLMAFVKKPLVYLDALKGGPKLHLIMGNHDPLWIKRVPHPEEYFSSIDQTLCLTDGGIKLLLCHDPAEGLALLSEGQTLVYGHVHNNIDRPFEPELRRLGDLALNCSAELTCFRPVALNELVACNRSFRAAHPIPTEQEAHHGTAE